MIWRARRSNRAARRNDPGRCRRMRHYGHVHGAEWSAHVTVLRVRGHALPDGGFVDLYADGDRWTTDPVPGAELVAEGWLLPGLVDGSLTGAVGLGGSVTVSSGKASGDAGTVLGGALAKVILVPTGDDVAGYAISQRLQALEPIPDPQLAPDIPVPECVRRCRRW